MAFVGYDDYLLLRLREVYATPPPGVKPWNGRQLVDLANRVSQSAADHRTFYLGFVEGIRDLLRNPREDRILRRFATHAAAAEPRIHADDPDVRDHLTHVTQVYLCGWLILNSCGLFSDPSVDWWPYSCGSSRFEWLNHAWVYTALLHDCAYSVEYAKRSQAHEQMVKALFGDCYIAGQPGSGSKDRISDKADLLWKEREKYFERPVPNRPDHLLHRQYERPDHAIVGGIALWSEAKKCSEDQSYRGELPQILRASAVAIACHNFQYLIDAVHRDSSNNRWLALDLFEEPLGMLLHFCDELQEWSRERADEHFLYGQGSEPVRYASTDLTHLQVYDLDGLSINARLLRRLHPADRRVRHRLRREQEMKIADKTRTLGLVFRQRNQQSKFQVRLQITQTVDDQSCTNALLVNWPRENAQIPWREAGDRIEVGEDLHDCSVALRVGDGNSTQKHTVLQVKNRKAIVDLERLPRRLVVRARGGAGKSTLLKAIFRDCSPYHPVYVEQLTQQLGHLAIAIEEYKRRVKKASTEHIVLLLIDHLDRVVDDDAGPYWVDQLRSLDDFGWLHVIVACRPEEYDRYLHSALSNPDRSMLFQVGEWTSDQSLLLPPAENTLDNEGRPRALGLEDALVGDLKSCTILASCAGTMQLRRFIPPGIVDPTLMVTEFQSQIEKGPILIYDSNSNVRFRHDCIQDFFSAYHLALLLKAHSQSSNSDLLISDAQLLELLPRDVLRMLFDFLSRSNDSKLMTSSEKASVARSLAHALFLNCTIQQWLYDTGRLRQAHDALELFVSTYANDDEIVVIANKFLGHAAYERFSPNALEKLKTKEKAIENAKRAVDRWGVAAIHTEKILRRLSGNTGTNGMSDLLLASSCKWMLAFLMDHLMLTLHRAPNNTEFSNLTRMWAKELCSQLDAAGGKALEAGWGGRVLSNFADTPVASRAPADQLFCSLFEEVKSVAEERNSDWLDVRLAHLASHIGNCFLGEGFRQEGNIPPSKFDATLLETAIKWFETSTCYRERVLRRMQMAALRGGEEVFASECQGHADNANQQRGVFEALFMMCRGAVSKELPVLAALLLAAYQQHEHAWARARFYRKPSERLPNMFSTCLRFLAFGNAMSKSFELSQAPSEVDVRREIERSARAIFREHQMIAEEHARDFGEPFRLERILDYLPVNPVDTIVQLWIGSRGTELGKAESA